MRHGTLTAATTYRCPCTPCREVQYRYTKQWQIARKRGHKHKVDAAPSHRKIQALAAMGHTYTSMAKQARYAGPAAIVNILKRDLIRATTEVRIEEMFQAMQMRIAPNTREGRKVKAAAKQRRWKVPMAWDDIHAGARTEDQARHPLADQARPHGGRGVPAVRPVEAPRLEAREDRDHAALDRQRTLRGRALPLDRLARWPVR